MSNRPSAFRPSTTGAAGQASGKHQGLHQPDDPRNANALDNIGLDDRGELMEDHLRDRHSKGVRGGYDDSIDHDVIDHDVATPLSESPADDPDASPT